MIIVLLSSLGVGGATVLGALLGFIFRRGIAKRTSEMLTFAAGVSVGAAVLGLILPSVELSGKLGVFITVLGVFAGGLCVNFIDKIIPGTERLLGVGSSDSSGGILLFVLAIAIHNLPEGIAAGVGFGAGDAEMGIFIAVGIAIQNLPEGMIIIGPLLSLGVSNSRAFIAAAATGLIEVIGTFIGYYAAASVSAVLPLSLAFAGGTMLYVVGSDALPSDGGGKFSGYLWLLGFSVMLIFNGIL